MQIIVRLVFATSVAAAATAAANDFQSWNNASVQGRLSGDLLFTADASMRFADNATRWSQSLYRGGLGWRASPHLVLWGGYAHVRIRQPYGGRVLEHRTWQQASYPVLNIARARITGRTRLEQRWLEGQDGTSWRLRQQVRVAVPLGQGPRAPNLVAGHELFWNLDDGGIAAFREGADQNRTVVGLNVPLASRLQVEPVWVRQRLEVPNPDRVNDIAQLSLSLAM